MAAPLAMAFGAPFAIVTFPITTEIGVGTHCVEDVNEDDCASAGEVKQETTKKAVPQARIPNRSAQEV